ncbi:hypothetical protein [Actinoplanes sp. NPDC048796]|uniref:hypothetical protein n=1 Tax=Actinoplanes sp. NPDC048796 TaxID=3155640 RepID=UPI0033CB9FCA
MTDLGAATGALDFSPYIADRTRDFTGREWVFSEVDTWLSDDRLPPRMIIMGEPGVGKSAIAARLTQLADVAASHFCIARSVSTIDPSSFSRSISQQLCRIDGFARKILNDGNVSVAVTQNVYGSYSTAVGATINNLVINSPSGSVAFVHTVLEPLRSLFAEGFDQRVLLVVDGLDEAMRHQGPETIVDLLANSGELPAKVRLVLTSRPDRAVWRQFEAQRVPYFRVDADRPENLADIRDYVRAQIRTSRPLRDRVAEQDPDTEEFVSRLFGASGGNFLYVVWLLPSIAAGTQRFDTTAALPRGIVSVYREFLRNRKTGNDTVWRTTYAPILRALVVAQESLDRDLLARLTGLGREDTWYGVQDLYQFMDPAEADSGRYFLYHQSISDWLVEQSRAQDFWIDRDAAHQRVVDHYRGPATSWAAVDWRQVDDYGVCHLAKHLFALRSAGARTQLYDLICQPYMREKYRRSLSHRAFADDVELMIRAAGQSEPVEWAPLVRGCLLYSSLGLVSSKITPRALGLLARIENAGTARDYAALIPHPRHRCDAYLEIGGALLNERQPGAAREAAEQAAAVASGLPDDGARWEELARAAELMARAGDRPRAMRIIDGLLADRLGVQARAAAVSALAAAGDLTRAWSTAQLLEYGQRARALGDIIRAAVAEGNLAEARRVRDVLLEGADAADPVVEALAGRGRLDDAGREVALIASERSRDLSRVRVASAMAVAGEYERALVTAAATVDPSVAMEAFSGVAIARAEAGEPGAVAGILEQATPERPRALELAQRAVDAAAGTDASARSLIHFTVADVMTILDRAEDTSAFVGAAVADIGGIEDPEVAVAAWSDGAVRLAACQRREEAVLAAREAARVMAELPDPDVRRGLLATVSRALDTAGLADESVAIAARMREESAALGEADRVDALLDIAFALPVPAGREIITAIINEVAGLVAEEPSRMVAVALLHLRTGPRRPALEIASKILAKTPDDARALLEIADLASELFDRTAVTRVLEQAADAALRTPAHDGRAATFVAIADRTWNLQDGPWTPEWVRRIGESALHAVREMASDIEAVELMCDLAAGEHSASERSLRWRDDHDEQSIGDRALRAAADRAERSTDPYVRAVCFCRLAVTTTGTGDHLAAKKAADRAAEAAAEAADPRERAFAFAATADGYARMAGSRTSSAPAKQALLAAAQAFSRAGRRTECIEAAGRVLALVRRSPPVEATEAMTALSLAGRREDAVAIGSAFERSRRNKNLDLFAVVKTHLGIDTSWIRFASDAIERAARGVARAYAVDEARELAGILRDPLERTAVLVDIVDALAGAGLRDGARELLYDVLSSAEAVTGEPHKWDALRRMATALAECGRVDEAWTVVRRIEDADVQRDTLVDVAGTVAGIDEGTAGVSLPEGMGGLEDVLSALARIAEVQAGAGQTARAIEAARRVAREAGQVRRRGHRLTLLTAAATTLARAGEVDRSVGLTEKVRAEFTAKGFASKAEKAAVGTGLATVFAVLNDSHRVAEIVEVVLTTADSASERVRARTLRDLAQHLNGVGSEPVLDQITEHARRIRSVRERVIAFGGVIEAMAGAGRAGAARDLTDQAIAVTAPMNELDRVTAVDSLSRSAVRSQQAGIIAAVGDVLVRMATALRDQPARVAALRAQVWFLERTGRHHESMSVLREALMAAHLAGRDETLTVLGYGALTLAREDRGTTLWNIYTTLEEMDSWWPAPAVVSRAG